MKKTIVVALVVLASVTGCKTEGASSPSPSASSGASTLIPSVNPSVAPSATPPAMGHVVFKPHTDHVPPNPEVMGVEERKKLSPLGQELVALLDDYVYVFNNRIPQKDGDKFAAVDPAGVVQPGEKLILKLKATDQIGGDGPAATIAVFAELRRDASDPKPFWSGKQQFRFNTQGDEKLRLGYWNESAP